MKIGVLTSTRADFGIYMPLLNQLFKDDFFQTEIIAFGTHLSKKHGYTLSEIEQAGYPIKHKMDTLPKGDKPKDISRSMALTINKFSEFWDTNKFDLIFALGDRYEMFAAVSAGVPFNLNFAHIHAGETTLGAIDNAFRHSISLFSKYLFVSTEAYKKRAIEITKMYDNVFNVGALSIDNLKKVKLYTKKEFFDKYKIDLNIPTILTTFHPETVNLDKNKEYINELLASFSQLQNKYQIVITMPNADAMGLMIRKELEKFAKHNKQIILIENFGMKGYLTCMRDAAFMIGNTSSGFVEASFFPKWVINLGERQRGRIITENIKTIPIKAETILKTVEIIEKSKLPENCNIYGYGDTAHEIVKIIKSVYNT